MTPNKNGKRLGVEKLCWEKKNEKDIVGLRHLPGIWRRFTNGNTWEIPLGILQRLGIFIVLFFFPTESTLFSVKCVKSSSSWSKYSDLNTTSKTPKGSWGWWNPVISGKSRLVKYYNLARTRCFFFFFKYGHSDLFGEDDGSQFFDFPRFFLAIGCFKHHWGII